MSTPAQVLANRANAVHSTGPVTEEGKSAAKLNSITHGLTSKTLVLPHESQEEYNLLHLSFQRDYKPATDTERELVSRMSDAWWRLQRAYRVETSLLAKCIGQSGAKGDDAMADLFLEVKESSKMRLFMRYLAATERAWGKALADFNQARKERQKDSEVIQRHSIEKMSLLTKWGEQPAPKLKVVGFASKAVFQE